MSVTGVTTTYSVADETALDQAIQAANALTAGHNARIVLTADIAEASAPTAIALASGVKLTISGKNAGANYKIDGGGAAAGLYVKSGDVTLTSLAISDDLFLGQQGNAGGGGGAGLGGGLFVGSQAVVTLDDALFTKDSAQGGAGGYGVAGQPGGVGAFPNSRSNVPRGESAGSERQACQNIRPAAALRAARPSGTADRAAIPGTSTAARDSSAAAAAAAEGSGPGMAARAPMVRQAKPAA